MATFASSVVQTYLIITVSMDLVRDEDVEFWEIAFSFAVKNKTVQKDVKTKK